MTQTCTTTAGFVLAALVGLGASPQQTGSISGVITDTTGAALPGATITAVSEDGRNRVTVTSATGRYRVEELLPGRYRIEARMSGFVAKSAERGVLAGRDEVWSGALLVGRVADERSIERQVRLVAGADAADCGRHSAVASAGQLRRSLECGLSAVRARQPFSIVVQFADTDPQTGRGLLARSDGRIQMFQYDSGFARFSLQDCPNPGVTRNWKRAGARFEYACLAPRTADY